MVHACCVVKEWIDVVKTEEKGIFEEIKRRNGKYDPDHFSHDTLVLRGSMLGGV